MSTDLAGAAAIYKQRFADANDFTFLFVGSFDEKQVISLCQRYLGNLPVQPGSENWKDVQPDLPDGVVKRVAKKGTDPQSTVSLTFHGPFEYNRTNRFTIRMMASVLNIKLREELREAVEIVHRTPRVDQRRQRTGFNRVAFLPAARAL